MQMKRFVDLSATAPPVQSHIYCCQHNEEYKGITSSTDLIMSDRDSPQYGYGHPDNVRE